MPVNQPNRKGPKARYWNTWYIIVLAVLVAEIIAFVWLTNRFK